MTITGQDPRVYSITTKRFVGDDWHHNGAFLLAHNFGVLRLEWLKQWWPVLLIGLGVATADTSLLVVLAKQVAPELDCACPAKARW